MQNKMMITENAPAKINLALHVRARRADGYHELETMFAFLADGDRLCIAPALANNFTVTGPFSAGLAGEGDNLVTRALAGFSDIFGVPGPLAITLDKHLPVASGIGGGSADAAATLRGLARLSGVAVDDPRLFSLAEQLGADVPACLLGKSAIGTGKGEHLAPVGGVSNMPVLLVNPGIAVSTAAVFRAWDGVDRGAMPMAGTLIERAIAARNDLAPPAMAAAPVIGEVVGALSAMPGVVLARMSGSGATCFALFETNDQRAAAAHRLGVARPEWWLLESTLA
jgi:4-diphosphocytidyl-2-C-methyl-D-erythritol kinase